MRTATARPAVALARSARSLCASAPVNNGQCGGGGGRLLPTTTSASRTSATEHKCRAKIGATCTSQATASADVVLAAFALRVPPAAVALKDKGCKTGRCNTTSKTCRPAVLGGGCWVDTDCAKPGSSNINCSKSGSPEPFVCGGKGAVCSASADCSSTQSGNLCPTVTARPNRSFFIRGLTIAT